MAPDKDKISNHNNILAQAGLSSKTITALDVYVHGVVTVIEIGYSGGPQYIKVRQSTIEYGGTTDWGTGTQIRS